MDFEKVTQLNESLYELHRPQGVVPSMQVVFFHGFQHGSYDKAHLSTWLSKDESCIWPQDWLKEQFGDAQILSVSYNAMLSRRIQNVDLFIVVENLVSDLLQANVGQEPRCPVVLVGHSFGGLVIKQLCVRARNLVAEFKKESGTTLRLNNLLNNLKGFFFYSTPHIGTPVVDPELLRADSPLMKYVKNLSNETARLNSDFEHLKVDSWQMAGLGESLPSKWGKFTGIVVPEASSRRDGNFNIVAADHVSISRPRSRKDRRFYALTDLLKRVTEFSKKNELPENWQSLPELVTGMGEVLEELEGDLHATSKLGIVGMGGIGKTTFAMALFNKLEYNYDFTCFITDVKQIEGPIKNVEEAVLENVHYRGQQSVGPGLRLKMRGKKLLLVLDDVNSERDLEVVRILIDTVGVHKDSRFIATSRNRDILESYMHKVRLVPFLSHESSKELFLSCAPIGCNPPLDSYVDDIVHKCDGLPLTLRVIGKYINTKPEESFWKEIVELLDKATDVADLEKTLWGKLRISYNGLPKDEKGMFLDATTVFYQSELSTALAAWNNTMTGPARFSWRHLVDLCLVWEIRYGERIEIGIHEQLLSLGRKIGSTPNENGCRIWNDSRNAFELLSADNSSLDVDDLKDIVALKSARKELDAQYTGSMLPGMELAPQWGRPLCKMKKLQYLSLEGFDIDQTDLRLPSKIVYLHLSSMTFSDFPFDPSHHSRMAILSLRYVRGFHSLPAKFYQLRSLQILTIEGIDILERLPDSFGNLPSLTQLIIEGCPSLKMLPNSLGQLVALETLRIGYCDSLSELPNSIGDLFKLKDISITRCSGLENLPVGFLKLQALEHMELNETSLQCVPDLKVLKSLKTLLLSWKRPAQFPHALPECLKEMVLESGYKYPLTFNVVDGIFEEVHRGDFQSVGHNIVGVDAVLDGVQTRLTYVNSLGLVGMGGLGKTTLSKVLFNHLAPAYEYTCFLSEVQRIGGSVSDTLLNELCHFGAKLREEERKKGLRILRGKRLLLTLDDVSEGDLDVLRILTNEFGIHNDSRFVATSRNQQLLRGYVDVVYPIDLFYALPARLDLQKELEEEFEQSNEEVDTNPPKSWRREPGLTESRRSMSAARENSIIEHAFEP
ncbi:unnamed protein product [Calypogeia fissa]